jgi:DNA-binding transcriptional LysR family regulator
LERAIGARVLDRTGRGVALNAIGTTLALHGRAIRGEAQAAHEAARAAEQPVGTLRIATPAGIADALLLPMLTAFLQRHPGLRLAAFATDALADLLAERLDLAFRIGRHEAMASADGRMIVRALHRGTDILVSAPRYLAGRTPIEVPADLARHPWIGFAAHGENPVFEIAAPDGALTEVRMDCRVATTSGLSIRDWVVAGAGVARMPDFAVRAELADGRMVQVLPGHTVGRASLYAVYPPERLRPANVRRLIDFAKSWFAPLPG